MKLLFLLPVAAVASKALSSEVTNMQVTLENLVAQSARTGAPISTEVKKAIADILEDITEAIEPALDTDKANAQQMLDNALAAVNKCKTDRTSEFNGIVATRTSDKTTATDNFHDCKDGNAGLLQKRSTKEIRTNPTDPNHGQETHPTHDYGHSLTRNWHSDAVITDTSHQVHAHTVEDELCTKLNNTVKGFGNSGVVLPQKDSDYCANPPPFSGDGACDALYTFNDNLDKKSHSWFKHMDQFESANAQKYKDERDACHQARQQHIVRINECNRLQTLFEQAVCAEANEIDEQCAYYKDCYDTMKAEWEATKSNVQDLEDQFKKQQHALEILNCYGEQIQADSTDLSACSTAREACVRCSPALDVSKPNPHDEVACSEAKGENRPCHLNWFNTNYGEYFNSDTPVNDCQVCAAPATVDFVSPNA